MNKYRKIPILCKRNYDFHNKTPQLGLDRSPECSIQLIWQNEHLGMNLKHLDYEEYF